MSRHAATGHAVESQRAISQSAEHPTVSSQTVLFLAGLAFLGLALALGASEVTPEVGAQGTAIRIDGVQQSTDDPAVILLAPSGNGVLVDDPRWVNGSVYGTLGPAAEPFVGQVETWWGRRFQLPPKLLPGPHVSYLTHTPTWFIGQRTEPMTDTFTFHPKSPGTLGAPLTSARIEVDVLPWMPVGDFFGFGLRVDIVIDGGSGGGGGGSEPPPFHGGGKRLRSLDKQARILNTASLVVKAIPASNASAGQTLSAYQLATDLAGVLNETFGPLGLVADSQGSVLRISNLTGDGLRGFATLQLCSNGC